MPQGKLSGFQKNILYVLLEHVEEGKRRNYQSLSIGMPVKEIRDKGVSRADSASFSRALARLEKRRLVICNNVRSGLPQTGRLRCSLDEPPPLRTDHLILTPEGEESATRVNNKLGIVVNR